MAMIAMVAAVSSKNAIVQGDKPHSTRNPPCHLFSRILSILIHHTLVSGQYLTASLQ
jgi:hypothetical protein